MWFRGLLPGGGPEREALEEIVTRDGLGDAVRFLGTRGDLTGVELDGGEVLETSMVLSAGTSSRPRATCSKRCAEIRRALLKTRPLSYTRAVQL